MNASAEVLRLSHPDGREYFLGVTFCFTHDWASVEAYHLLNGRDSEQRVWLAEWQANYEPPNKFDPGHVQIGSGRIELEGASLRGIGIGSLLMLPLVRWIKSRPEAVPVANIDLAGEDATTPEERDRRNRFYEKLGFTFHYSNDKTRGISTRMLSSQLIQPAFRLSRGWCVESIEQHGCVF